MTLASAPFPAPPGPQPPTAPQPLRLPRDLRLTPQPSGPAGSTTSTPGERVVSPLRHWMALQQASGVRLGWRLAAQEPLVEIWWGGQEGMVQWLEKATRTNDAEGVARLALELDGISGTQERDGEW